MTDASSPDPSPLPETATAVEREIESASAIESVRLFIGEVRSAAASEIELAKACGAIVGASAKTISIWGAVALITLFVAILALAIGLMLALATITGPWWAAIIVPGALLLVTGGAGLVVRRAAQRAKAAVTRLSS